MYLYKNVTFCKTVEEHLDHMRTELGPILRASMLLKLEHCLKTISSIFTISYSLAVLVYPQMPQSRFADYTLLNRQTLSGFWSLKRILTVWSELPSHWHIVEHLFVKGPAFTFWMTDQDRDWGAPNTTTSIFVTRDNDISNTFLPLYAWCWGVKEASWVRAIAEGAQLRGLEKRVGFGLRPSNKAEQAYDSKNPECLAVL